MAKEGLWMNLDEDTYQAKTIEALADLQNEELVVSGNFSDKIKGFQEVKRKLVDKIFVLESKISK